MTNALLMIALMATAKPGLTTVFGQRRDREERREEENEHDHKERRRHEHVKHVKARRKEDG